MNCNEFNETILDHSRLEQIAAEPEAAAHLEGCSACRERLEFERSLAAGFRSIVAEEPPIELAGRVLNIPAYVAGEERAAAAVKRPSMPETLVIEPERVGAEAPLPARERPAREIPWWQAFWFRAGVSFAAAGFLLAIGVSQFLTTGSSVDGKRMEMARGSVTEVVKSAPKAPVAPVPATEQPVPAAADAEPEAEKMMMAQAPAVPAETKAQSLMPAAPPPEPPAFGEQADNAADQLPLPPAFKADPELAAARQAETPAPSGATANGPSAAAGAVEADSDKREQVADRVKDAPVRREKPPKVVGEPLVAGKEKRKDLVETRISLAKKAVVAPAPVLSKGFVVGGRARPAQDESDILLRESESAGTKQAADELSPDFEAGFAPPPPAKSAVEAFREDFIDESTIGVSPRKQARIEEIMAAHSQQIQAGTLDIDQWVLAGWITVRERIMIAPPDGTKWVAVKSGSAWKAELRTKR